MPPPNIVTTTVYVLRLDGISEKFVSQPYDTTLPGFFYGENSGVIWIECADGMRHFFSPHNYLQISSITETIKKENPC